MTSVADASAPIAAMRNLTIIPLSLPSRPVPSTSVLPRSRPPLGNIQTHSSAQISCPLNNPDGPTTKPKFKRRSSKQPTVTTLLGHKSGVTGVAFNCTGTLVASSSSDGTVQVWSTACLEAGAKPLRTLVGHRAGVHCIAFDPLDPDRLASGSQDQRLIIWSISESASKLKLVSNDHKGVHSVSFSPKHPGVLAAGQAGGGVQVVDSTNGEVLAVLATRGTVHATAFSQAGLLATGDSGTVALWSIPSGKEKLTIPDCHEGPVTALAFCASGARLASASSEDKTVVVSCVKTGAAKMRIQAECNLRSVAWWSIGVLATGGSDGVLRLWDDVGGDLLQELRGHSGEICSAEFHPGEECALVTGGADTTVKRWRIENVLTRREKLRFALLGCVGYARDLEGKEEGKALEEVIVRTALLPDDLVRYLIEFVGAGIV